MVVKNIKLFFSKRYYSTLSLRVLNGKTFETDSFTNLTPSIVSRVNRKLYKEKEHPLGLLKERIVQFFYSRFKNARGNPLFSVYDDLDPIVTTHQNFDSLLVPKDHPSRSKSDCYYLNKEWMLRAHMTAHQAELISMGLNNFLMVGDVYRRDHVDATHYSTFHQLDGVRLLTPEELFVDLDDGSKEIRVSPNQPKQRTKLAQEHYTEAATKLVEIELKKTLENLSKDLFGKDIQYRWVDAYFPFTHPSWELEVYFENKWMEMLGCGVMEHQILQNAGCQNRIGWAFGLGLERLAMAHYSIPDIRIFWSTDPGFLHQFKDKTWSDKVKFKPVSVYPPCPFDISFWLNEPIDHNDFFELAREHCGDLIEQISLIDSYKNPKTGRESLCFRLTYRSMDRTCTKEELRVIHKELEQLVVKRFNVEMR